MTIGKVVKRIMMELVPLATRDILLKYNILLYLFTFCRSRHRPFIIVHLPFCFQVWISFLTDIYRFNSHKYERNAKVGSVSQAIDMSIVAMWNNTEEGKLCHANRSQSCHDDFRLALEKSIAWYPTSDHGDVRMDNQIWIARNDDVTFLAIPAIWTFVSIEGSNHGSSSPSRDRWS